MEGSIGDTGANSMNRREILKKGHWSHEEDELLLELVRRYGPRRWKHIATHIRGRRASSCRARWANHLNPRIDKTPFSEVEQERLLDLHQDFGNQWATIVCFFPGRTDNQLKNQYNSLVATRKMKALSPSHNSRGRGCANIGSVDLSGHVNLTNAAVGSQSFDFAWWEKKSSDGVPCLIPMPGLTRMPVSDGCSSFNLSTYSGNIYADLISYADSVLDARSATSRLSQMVQSQRVGVENHQFIDFMGVGDSE